MGKNKIIFLDVDGVLNSETHATLYGWGGEAKHSYENAVKKAKLNTVSVHLVNELARKSGAQIVMSTSWRLLNQGARGFWWNQLFKEILNSVSKRCYMDVIDLTPVKEKGDRGDEIDAWLKKNPWVDDYIILDDISDEWRDHQKEKLLLIDDEVGFTRKNLEQALSVLQ